ncbi:LLM class flavin-dependent oxidoreductase [Streptomyces sp. NPDC020742]|uniref:LLM class flavin-dependent oxidoreductase n=1 Tax=unclassified Streptomyces TaxID=2593676 RepID=UPI0033C1E2D8
MYPAQPDAIGPAVEFARFAQETCFTRLWFGQSLRLDSHLTMAALTAHVPGLPLGTSIALAPLRHPYQAAVEARTLSALSGAGLVAGYGPGSVEFQKSFLGEAFDRPLKAMGEYLSVVRRLLDGETVEHEGEQYRLTAGLPRLAAPPAEVGLGVLRPGMARTAGRFADVAITWLTPPHYVAEQLRPAMEAGAAERGRKVPRVAAVVHAAVSRPGRNPARAAYTAVGAHLSTDHYTDMLRRAGVEADPGEPVKGAEALVESEVFLTGTPDDIAAALCRFHHAGVDEVILNLSGVHFTEGEAAARRDLRDIASAGGLG